MKLIAITPESNFSSEVEFIEYILENGIDYVHIRKPMASIQEIRNLITQIDAKFHSRLKLHSCFELAAEYSLGGIHLNKRVPYTPINYNLSLSKSCHSIAELTNAEYKYEYKFLSPIYDSISKDGYLSKFNINELEREYLSDVIALGGVTPEKLPELHATGFLGAAFLGYIFSASSINDLTIRINTINKYNRLCYNS